MIARAGNIDSVACATGIRGLDEVTGGGLPRDGITLVRGDCGSGTTTLAMEFLVRGAREFDAQGLFFSFEERNRDLLEHFALLDLPRLVESGSIRLDEVGQEKETFRTCRRPQCFDLDALLSRLEQAIDVAGADRVVLDGVLEFLLPEYEDRCIGEQEVRRLFRCFKKRGATIVLTCGQEGEQYPAMALARRLADCVLSLERPDARRVSDRRLQVMKHRGGQHGNHRYPFIIADDGMAVLPVGSISLEYGVGEERISTGVPGLDAMLGHAGFYRGSGVLVTGAAGTGKTTLGTRFAEAACARGERALYFSFEEPPGEIIRNMDGVGVELEKWKDQGILGLEAMRPAERGLGGHILRVLRAVEGFSPQVVVIDPLPAFTEDSSSGGLKTMLTHLVDRLKKAGITTLFTDLTPADHAVQAAQSHVASLMDTWINLRNVRMYGQRSLLLEILKSRGTGHSRNERELTIGEPGLALADQGNDPGTEAGQTGRRWLNARGLT